MFEAFAIGVSIRLMDRVTPGLLGMTTHFRKAGAEAEILQAKVAKIGRTMALGTAMTGAGLGIFAALTPALREAERFQTQVAKFSLYGMGDKANAEAVRFAKAMNIVGSSYTDNMRLITESQGIFRESGKLTLVQQLQGAKIAAPILAKLSFIESSLSDDKRASAHTQDLAMLRFIESRGGANDPRTFAGIADWGFKLSKSSGGVVPWSQLQQLAATSGVAGFNLSQDAIAKLEPVVADLTGGRTGSGLRVAFQRLLGTQRGLPVQAISEFLKLGLWDPTKVELKSGGGIKQFLGRPGEVLRDRQLFATDPFEFYRRDFLPALAKKYGPGILGDSVQARTERAVETSLIFGPGTASAVFSQMDKLFPAIARSVAAQNKTLGIDASAKVAGNTFAGQRIAAEKAFRDTLELTGEAILPLATSAMRALLPPLRAIDAFAVGHPRLFDGIVSGIVGLGAALVVGGTVTNLVATAQALKLVGGLARTALFAEETGLLTRLFPAIGGAVEGLAGSLGLTVGALAGTVAIGAAAAAAIGFTIYEVVKHWTAGKSIFWNVRHELTEFQSWVTGWSNKAIALLPKPIQAPVRAVAGQLTFGLADGTFMERLRLISSAVAPFLAKLGAIADGLSGHVRSWLDFGGKLGGAFGRVYSAITGFLDRIVALPGQWIAAHVPHLPGMPKPAPTPGVRPPAPGAKPAAPPLSHIIGGALGKAALGLAPVYGQLAALPSPDKIRSALARAKFLDAPKSAGAWLDSILPSKAQAHAAGQDVSKGVAGGIVAAHPAVRAAAAGTATQAVVAFKAAADIHSPSRVFAGLGDQLIMGLIVGV